MNHSLPFGYGYSYYCTSIKTHRAAPKIRPSGSREPAMTDRSPHRPAAVRAPSFSTCTDRKGADWCRERSKSCGNEWIRVRCLDTCNATAAGCHNFTGCPSSIATFPALSANSCPCAHTPTCFHRPVCTPSPLCATPRGSHLHSTNSPFSKSELQLKERLPPPRVSIVTSLCFDPGYVRAAFKDRPSLHYIYLFKLLVNLLHTLRLVGTRLPVMTMVTSRFLSAEAELERLGTRIRPVDALPPPPWADRAVHLGTFTKLRLASLVELDKLIYLDGDVQLVRNIDHLCLMPAPAAVFHGSEGFNSGVMVLQPSHRMAEMLMHTLHQMPYSVRRDGGDQAVWQHYFDLRNESVYELPVGYNFRSHFGMSDRSRCDIHVLHGAYEADPAAILRPTIGRHLCERASSFANEPPPTPTSNSPTPANLGALQRASMLHGLSPCAR